MKGGVAGGDRVGGMNSLKYDEHGGGNFSYMDTTRHRAVNLRSPFRSSNHANKTVAGVGR